MVSVSPIYLPILFAVIASVLYGASYQIQNMGLQTADPRTGAVVTIGAAAVAYWLIAPWLLHAASWFAFGTVLFVVAGLIRPALSGTLSMTGIKLIGPTLTSGLEATSPIFAVVFAIALLGEELTLPVALGTFAVAAGVAVAFARPQNMARSWPLWALFLPLGAAFIRAIAHATIKVGLLDVPDSYFAGLVGTTTSFLIVLAVFKGQGRRFSGAWHSYAWFALAGTVNGIAVYCLNEALKTGKLIVVAPIVASSPIIAMLLGLLVFRRETISWRTVATVFLVVGGVILVVSDA